MPNYRRAFVPGGSWFFTVNLLDRRQSLLVDHVATLREAIAATRADYAFTIDAFVVLPDHLHAIWTLPPGDSDFSIRWRLIKMRFAKALPKREQLSTVRVARNERGIWQRRFWEHLIRNEDDYARHVEYCYIIRSSTGSSHACATGRILHSIATCAQVCFPRIGAATWQHLANSANVRDGRGSRGPRDPA